MDCSPPGSSVHGILQARILEWVAIPFSRGFSQPRDRTWVSCIEGGLLTIWATREAPLSDSNNLWLCGQLQDSKTSIGGGEYLDGKYGFYVEEVSVQMHFIKGDEE